MTKQRPKWQDFKLVRREHHFDNLEMSVHLQTMMEIVVGKANVYIGLEMNTDYAEDGYHLVLSWIEMETEEERLARVKKELVRRKAKAKRDRLRRATR